MGRSPRLFAALLPAALLALPASAINIQFDYTYDTSNFFAQPSRRDLLNQAAATFTPFTDSLAAIIPSGINTWTANFNHPGTGNSLSIPNLTVPANTLIIYVGARNLPGLGVGGPGGFGASGTQNWINTIVKRGQPNATQDVGTSTDFGPWGGALAFNSTANWFFGSAPQGQAFNQSDFLSVAIHELGHALGFGTAPSFQHYTSGLNFTGPSAQSLTGASVALHDAGHWAESITGSPAPGVTQPTAMNPAILQGTRQVFTDLDYAAMSDIGWQINVPNTSLPGDANADGIINNLDRLALLNGITNRLSGWHNGDFNGNGIAEADDFALFQYFAALNPAGASPSTPEPTTLATLLPTTLLFLRRRL